jgi:hypothetical protein
MAELDETERTRRSRVEGLIAVAAPFLDVVLGIGERISRIAEPTDHDYSPIRPGGDRPPFEPAGDDPEAPR